MNSLTIGILAHVDAGKTTLTEALLFKSGAIRKKGRVDHQDAFLDTNELEQKRGITILSKTATYHYGDKTITLLDTPGHIDFSPEAERAIIAMDYAVLVINGSAGLQSHTKTLWQLLKHYQVPVFIFINKTDLTTDKEALLKQLQSELSPNIIDFYDTDRLDERIAVTNEDLLNKYLDKNALSPFDISQSIRRRELFPCYFGSALHLTGIDELLKGMDEYSILPQAGTDFGAFVYKISHDESGVRLTHLKVIGGSLKVKEPLTTKAGEEKVNEIRLYNGERYENVSRVSSGTLCVLTGLNGTSYGDTFGQALVVPTPLLTPVMTYKVLTGSNTALHTVFNELKYFEDEDPVLNVIYKEALNELQIQVMGEVRLEILKVNMLSKFGTEINFSDGSVLYKETIKKEVTGYGHFEPLMHYAEVHLLLEPHTPGSGITLSSSVLKEDLAPNYQNQILNILKQTTIPGVLTGAPITDIKITLTGGISHIKHTEGGDFLEATIRAVRQGLMKATSVLLEPYLSFTISLPSEKLGRLLSDLSEMEGEFEPAVIENGIAAVTGSAPAITIGNYQKKLLSYSGGNGYISLTPIGYRPAHNSEQVLSASNYVAESDTDFPSSSVFCTKGKSFTLSWNQVDAHLKREEREALEEGIPEKRNIESHDLEADLKEIFERTYGKWDKRPLPQSKKVHNASAENEYKIKVAKKKNNMKKYLLIDGYNIVFAWPHLKDLAEVNLDAAREVLIDILSNYQGFVETCLILVFDAYKLKGHKEEVIKYKNLNIVFTKEAETADAYIEKTVHEIGRIHDVTIATSDRLEQIIAYGQGGRILSANDLLLEISEVENQIEKRLTSNREYRKNYLLDNADIETKKLFENIFKSE